MSSPPELHWPDHADADLADGVHRVLHDVTVAGGAIGYLAPPSPQETGGWLDEVLAEARAGDAALAIVRVDGVVQALGSWRRCPELVFAHSGEVQKVAAHPRVWGRGLGRVIVTGLVEHARRAGVETLDLGVRGNNHGAIQLYEEHGFRIWGRRPDVVAVGEDRYDEVRMSLRLNRPPRAMLRGSSLGGPGGSPRRPLPLETGPVEEYLREDDVVAWTGSPVADLARALRQDHPESVGYARAAFDYVRDRVAHSVDAADPRVALTSVETLALRTGLCFAKSHLLTALLRAEGIPAGLCYQRLRADDGRYALHGLVAVHLGRTWHRLDPRGNRPDRPGEGVGIGARFSLDAEFLAWAVRPELGEIDYPRVHPCPAPAVVNALRDATDALALCRSGLPDRL